MQRPLTVAQIPGHFAGRGDLAGRVVVTADDRELTWQDIDRRSAAVAAGLTELGLRSGARVATLLPNCAAYVEVMFGVARAGMAIVPLNSRSVAREIAVCLNRVGCETLITAPEFVDLVAEVLPQVPSLDPGRLVVTGAPASGGLAYEEWLAGAGPWSDRPVDESSLYWLPFTSGTTGDAKAATVTHRSLVQSWNTVAREFDLTSQERQLIAGPFYHSLGFLFGLAGLYAGGSITIHASFDPARVLDLIDTGAVTMTPMVPTMYTMLLAESGGRSFPGLGKLVSAGSSLLTGTKEGLARLFPRARMYEMYGSTEMGMATVLRPDDIVRKQRCVGQPVLGAELALFNEDGEPVALGEVGEVHKRGQLLADGYWENASATAALFREDWMASGDLGRFDDEGYLHIVDRKKDMVISGGANVFPAEIEEVIARLPGVLEVAVIGVPDEQWGEAVAAFVVTDPAGGPSAEAVLSHTRQELAGYKRPRRVEIVDALPKTGSGKLLKRELRDRFWQDAEAQVN